MIRIGIVGTGYSIGIAQQHVKAFKRIKEIQITALYDICMERPRNYIEKFQLNDAVVCKSYEELLAITDAVVICTANKFHVELSIKALESGKHILCEKPLAVNGNEASALIPVADRVDKVAMVGFCYRGIPAFRYIKKLLEEGMLGDIFYLRQSQGGNRLADPNVDLEWRMQNELSGPGAIADFGSHMMDISEWLLKDKCGPITEVQAMEDVCIKQRKDKETEEIKDVTNEDVAVWNARCENGTLLSFTSSRIGCATTLELCGSGGYIYYNADDPFHILWTKKEKDGGYTGGAELIEVPEEIYVEGEETPRIPFEINFYHQAVEFVKAIEYKKSYETNVRRGVYIQKLIDAVKASAQAGKRVMVDFTE